MVKRGVESMWNIGNDRVMMALAMTMTPEQRLLMQEGMEAFGGIAPTYRVALLDKPTIVCYFHSLMLGVQKIAVQE